MKKCRCFTLIELLVVITIIAILAALLLPVLARAKYKARLILCTNTLRQISIGVVSYTSEQNGFYPYRDVNFNSSDPKRSRLRFKDQADDRPKFEDYIPLSTFHCPLAPGDPDDIASTTPTSVNISYEMYFGSAIDNNIADSHMLKVGDEPVWNGTTFNILAADLDWEQRNFDRRRTSHDDGGMFALSGDPSIGYFCQEWRYNGSWFRNPIDRNFARTDGSVSTITHITYEDPRMIRVPGNPKYPGSTEYNYVPGR